MGKKKRGWGQAFAERGACAARMHPCGHLAPNSHVSPPNRLDLIGLLRNMS